MGSFHVAPEVQVSAERVDRLLVGVDAALSLLAQLRGGGAPILLQLRLEAHLGLQIYVDGSIPQF